MAKQVRLESSVYRCHSQRSHLFNPAAYSRGYCRGIE